MDGPRRRFECPRSWKARVGRVSPWQKRCQESKRGEVHLLRRPRSEGVNARNCRVPSRRFFEALGHLQGTWPAGTCRCSHPSRQRCASKQHRQREPDGTGERSRWTNSSSIWKDFHLEPGCSWNSSLPWWSPMGKLQRFRPRLPRQTFSLVVPCRKSRRLIFPG